MVPYMVILQHAAAQSLICSVSSLNRFNCHYSTAILDFQTSTAIDCQRQTGHSNAKQ